MIDTDKYEGHTEGPWKWLKDSLLLKGRAYATNRDAYCDSFIISHRHLDGDWPIDNKANAQLIADAPLLLAEVKRLQSQYEELKEALIGDSPNWTHDEVVEQALELATLNHNDGDRE